MQWSDFWQQIKRRLDYGAAKNGWGDLADGVNTLFGTHLTAGDAMIGAMILFPIIFFSILIVAYFRMGVSLKDRPGSTGELASIKDLKDFVWPTWVTHYMVWGGGAFVVFYIMLSYGPLITDILFGKMFWVFGPSESAKWAGMIATFWVIMTKPFREGFSRSGGFPLGYVTRLGGLAKQRIYLPLERRLSHVLVNGPTGGGKTTGYVEPQLVCDGLSDVKISDFAVDVKPDEDLIDNVGAAWTSHGKRVIHFNPWDPKSHFSINPLLDCKGQINDPETYNTVAVIVDAIFKAHEAEVGVASADASYFETQERDLLWALIAALLESPLEYRNLPMLYHLTRRPLVEVLSFISNLKAPFVMREIQAFASMNEKQQNDFMSGLRIKLQLFGMPGVKDSFINNDFRLEDFFREPTLFVVKAPLDKPSSFKVASLMSRLIMMFHYRMAPYMKKNDSYAFYFLDEFGSLRIPNITNVATTIRSSNGGLVVLLHDRADLLGQAMRRAGISSPQSMDNSLRTQIVIADSHIDTCKYYSDVLGRRAFVDRETSRNIFNVLRYNFRSVVREAPVMTPDEIKYLDEKESLVFLPNRRGFKLNQDRVYERKEFKQFSAMPYEVMEPTNMSRRLTFVEPDEELFANDGDLKALCEQLSNRSKEMPDAVSAPEGDVGTSGAIEPKQVITQRFDDDEAPCSRTDTSDLDDLPDEQWVEGLSENDLPMFQAEEDNR